MQPAYQKPRLCDPRLWVFAIGSRGWEVLAMPKDGRIARQRAERVTPLKPLDRGTEVDLDGLFRKAR